jgi:hypothetical protein
MIEEEELSMTLMMVRHRVKNYEQWKKVFDDNADLHREYGLRDGWIHCSVHDCSDLLVALRCDDVERARRFANSHELRTAMREGGVLGQPEIWFMEKVCDVPAPEEVPALSGTA